MVAVYVTGASGTVGDSSVSIFGGDEISEAFSESMLHAAKKSTDKMNITVLAILFPLLYMHFFKS